MTWFAGVDVGSISSKAVIIHNGEVVAYHLMPSGGNYQLAARRVMEETLAQAGLSEADILYTVATGYGAANVPFASHQITEISSTGRGISHLFPSVRTVIDIGGQASKVIRVNEEGRATHFVVSEKCAAGSGRFLQIIARVLQVDLQAIGPLSLKSQNPVKYTTGCAVFAESEAISRVAEGTPKEDILAGVHYAIASKIANLVDRVGLDGECGLTGGGAKDVGLVKRVGERLGIHLWVPPEPQIVAALGAALLAQERALRQGLAVTT